MALEFNHNKKSVLESIGYTEEDLDQFNTNLAEVSKKIILNPDLKISEISEIIAETFSYTELVLIATMNIIDKTKEMVDKNPILSIASLINKLKQEE